MSKKITSRSEIVGLKVYTRDAKYVGTVEDLAIDLADPANMSIQVKGVSKTFLIPIKFVDSLGDIIILKEGTPVNEFIKEVPTVKATPTAPPAPAAAPAVQYVVPRCPTCNSALIYYSQYGRWYCPKCKKYVEVKPEVLAKVPRCPTCNNYLSFIEQYGKWYCYHCSKYVEV